ncbi:hypothetical protein GCM10027601_16400 [Nocardioides ungokensis]
MLFDDRTLPVLEDDRSLVLAARTVLGEEARPVLPVCLDDDRARCGHQEDLATAPDSQDRPARVLDDAGQGGIAGDSERPVPCLLREASVAQVEPQQR